MSSESLTKYLEYFRQFVIPQWRINDNVHPEHHKFAIEQCTTLHDQIANSIDLINFCLSQGESLKTELRNTSEELGKRVGTMLHLFTRFGPRRMPYDLKWSGNPKYRYLDYPIACDYVSSMMQQCGISEIDPIAKTFTLCLNDNGDFDRWNRFTTPDEVANFNRRLFEGV